jgi:hypothetical protein
MRDDKWLFSKLDEVWDDYFSDIPQHNNVKIVWGRKAKNRLGSIKKGEKVGKHYESIITINSLFKDEKIPEFVVVGVIAHELTHYAHGFNSPLERKYQNPHAGGVVTKELKNRGLEKVLKDQKKWIKENWRDYLVKNTTLSTRPRARKRRIIVKWI